MLTSSGLPLESYKEMGALNSISTYAAIAVFCAGLAAVALPQEVSAGTAEASATSPGDWDDGAASSAGATLKIETFAGVNGLPGGQLTNTYATPNMAAVAGVFAFTFGTGLFDLGSRFGPSTWSGSIPKAGLTTYAALSTDYRLAAAPQLAYGMGKLSFLKPGTLMAEASVDKTAPKTARGGAYAKDPVPLPTGSYPYAATIGGTDTYVVDTDGNTQSRPTRLQVDAPGEIAWIEFSADDSNDSTFLTTQLKPIWDFAIGLDGTGSSPSLSAFFTYDPSRLSIPGAPTDPSLFQSYANSLLSALLSDTTDVLLTNVGSFGMTLDIINPVTLFNGTYTAAISTPGAADPNYPDRIDFEYGVGAGVAVVPEPSTFILLGIAFGLLRFNWRRSTRAIVGSTPQ